MGQENRVRGCDTITRRANNHPIPTANHITKVDTVKRYCEQDCMRVTGKTATPRTRISMTNGLKTYRGSPMFAECLTKQYCDTDCPLSYGIPFTLSVFFVYRPLIHQNTQPATTTHQYTSHTSIPTPNPACQTLS